MAAAAASAPAYSSRSLADLFKSAEESGENTLSPSDGRGLGCDVELLAKFLGAQETCTAGALLKHDPAAFDPVVFGLVKTEQTIKRDVDTDGTALEDRRVDRLLLQCLAGSELQERLERSSMVRWIGNWIGVYYYAANGVSSARPVNAAPDTIH